MNLYKIYNLPIYNHYIGKSLQYVLEGTNLAITKDNKYGAVLSDTEFIQCTLADRHFCALNTGLYHIDMSQTCVTALFFKDNNKINNHCRLAFDNITRPQAHYLDQGLWVISVETSIPMKGQMQRPQPCQNLRTPIHSQQPATSVQCFLFCT